MKRICFVDQIVPPIVMIYSPDINVPLFVIEDVSAKMDTEDKLLLIVAFHLKNVVNMSPMLGCEENELFYQNFNLHFI